MSKTQLCLRELQLNNPFYPQSPLFPPRSSVTVSNISFIRPEDVYYSESNTQQPFALHIAKAQCDLSLVEKLLNIKECKDVCKKHYFKLRKIRRKYDEFTTEEISYMSEKVFAAIYFYDRFHVEMLSSKFFDFSLSTVHTGDCFKMLMRYKVCYGLAKRCRNLYFCPNDYDFEKFQKFFEWRLNVIGGFCYVKFKTNDRMLPRFCRSDYDMLHKFVMDYSRNVSLRSRFINLSRYCYFMTKVLFDVAECRTRNRAIVEE
jgi:hypothetical protein